MMRLPVRMALLVATVCLLAVAPAGADVSMDLEVERGRPAGLFTDGMILQRELPVPIFGTAESGEQVTVTFNGQQKVTAAAIDGRWRVDLDPMAAGGPFVMTIDGNNQIVIADVRIGEVWVAAGQSNMTRKKVRRSILEANPSIRTLKKRDWNDKPGTNPYKIAQNLQAALGGVPVGLLNMASGGSVVLSWLGPTTASDPDPELQAFLKGNWGKHYRKFIAPIQPFRIRGVMWWQGEGDAKRTERHRVLLPAAMRSFRQEWDIGDFPWISMVIPTGRGLQFGAPPSALPTNPSATHRGAFMRHTFLMMLEEFPFSNIVSSIDLEGGTHPKDTTAYSKRMSDNALATVYGVDFAYSGPIYSSMSIEGNSIRIRYRENTADGLVAQGGPLQGFAVSDDEVTWYWGSAVIEGDEVVVSAAEVPNPIAARYAWENRPTWANLFNGAGLGAAAFATDVTPGEYGP